MKRAILLLLLLLLSPARIASADLAPLEITEEDASPSTFPYKVKFTNGSVTDNGDGTTSISTGGGITISTTTITGGTDTRVLFDDAGTVGEDAGLTYVKGTDALTVVGPLSAGNSTLADTTATSLTIDTLTTGVTLDTDGDGALSIASASSGFAEEIRVNLDDTSNTAVWNSSTGVTSWIFTGMSLESTGTAPYFRLTPSSGNAFEIWANGGIIGLANTTTGGQIWRSTSTDGFNAVGKFVAEAGAEFKGTFNAQTASSVLLPRPITIGTVAYTFPAADGTSGQFLTTNGSGELSFTTSSGSGDITSVGDVASGAAFDGTQGTILTFNNAGGDGTLDYDGTDFQASHILNAPGANLSADLTVTGAGADITLQATSSDAMGLHSEPTVPLRLVNETDGQDIWRVQSVANVFQTVTQLKTSGGADLRGIVDMTNAAVVSQTVMIPKTLAFPDLLQAEQDNQFLFEVDVQNYPFGFKITKVRIVTDASTTLTYNLEEWTSPSDGAPSTITSLPLAASDERTFTSFADSDIAAGSMVMVDLDTTDISWAAITVWGHAKTA